MELSSIMGLKSSEQKVMIFQHTAANFLQRFSKVLKIPILPPNSPNMGISSPTLCILGRKLSDQPKFMGGAMAH